MDGQWSQDTGAGVTINPVDGIGIGASLGHAARSRRMRAARYTKWAVASAKGRQPPGKEAPLVQPFHSNPVGSSISSTPSAHFLCLFYHGRALL